MKIFRAKAQKKNLIPVIILTGMISLLISCTAGGRTLPVASDGTIDLTETDWNKTQTVQLNGMWQFSWRALLAPADFRSGEKNRTTLIEVPSKWSANSVNEEKLTPWGFATYGLRIKHAFTGSMALDMNFPSTAFRLFIDGKEMPPVGIVSSDKEKAIPAFYSRIYTFTPTGGETEIIIQISNYHLNVGGILQPIIFGPEDNVQKQQDSSLAFDILLFGCLMIIGLYHLIIFLFRRDSRASLWFGLVAILMGTRSLVIGEHYLYQLLSKLDFQVLVAVDFIIISAGMPLFAMYIESLFSEFAVKKVRNLITASAGVFITLVIFTDSRVYSRYVNVIQLIIIFSCLYFFYIIIRAALRNLEGSKSIIMSFTIIFAAVINDILSANDIITSIQTTPIALMAFIFTQAVIISKNFSNAFRRVQELSTDLEIKVEERTRELEDERNLLKKRNFIMENELNLAKKIQQHIIPAASPMACITSIYEPVEAVGGDFYDFIRFPDKNRIGIFICDASGHGVPAAFIISMIKTILLQAGDALNDPAELFHEINTVLYGNSNGYFITAFYGIYDVKKRELRYSNAAHTNPIVISEAGTSPLGGYRSVPLGIMNSEDLRYSNKRYITETVIIPDDIRKIFLYTDGVSEITDSTDRSALFGDTLLNKSLHRNRNLTDRFFLEEVLKDMTTFSGSDKFDDDICMIALDIKVKA